MYYIEKFENLNATQKQEYFIELCNNPSVVQENILKEILKLNKNCFYGKKFNFSCVKNYEDFKKNIPITSWKDYRDYSLKMQNGEEDILFAGKTYHFITTSGTTGKSKLLPENKTGDKIKQLVSHIRNMKFISIFPEVLEGKYIAMANKTDYGKTKAGILIGSASGFTASKVDKNILKLSAFPMLVKEISNQESSDYAIMRFAIEQDVRTIAGNNAGRIPVLLEVAKKYQNEIIKDIREGTISDKLTIEDDIRQKLASYLKPNPKKADELEKELKAGVPFLPELYWKNLKIIRCWLSGSVGQFAKTLDPFLKNLSNEVVFFDAGYGASEGKFNIPLEPNTPYAPVALFSAFYEFLPLNTKEKDDFLLLHQLKDKTEYKIYITTYSGLYRYDLKDIIRVEGFTKNTPNIAFVSKVSDIANIAGEKIGVSFFQDAITQSLKKLNLKLVHFCVVVNNKELSYEFKIELENAKNSISSKRLQEELFEYFRNQNIAYRVYCEQNLLKPLRVSFMKRGWQDALYKEQERKGLTRSQIKLPILYETTPLADFTKEDKC